MRLSRTPIKTDYRAAGSQARAPATRPVAWGDDATSAPSTVELQSDNDDAPDYKLTSGSIWPSLAIAAVGVIAVTASGIFIAAALIDLSPVAIVNAFLPFTAPRATVADTIPSAPPVRQQAHTETTSRRITARAFAMWKDTAPSLFAAEAAAPHAFLPSRIYPPGFDILDGATLQSDSARVRLAEIATLPANTICLSDQSTKFACGLMARASLSVMVHGEKLTCYPDVSLDTDTPMSICQVRGRDVSQAQIEAGFALPSAPSLNALEDLAASARARHAGAWNGDWTIILTGSGGTGPSPASAVQ